MARYRMIHTKFWDDPEILDLTPEKKFFFIYLITNPQVRQCGIYEISIMHMVYQTGYNRETVEKLISFFETAGKIKYSKETNEICIRNFLRYNNSKSTTVQKCIKECLNSVKNKELLDYIETMDSPSIVYGGNKKKKKKNNKDIVVFAVDLLNEISGSRFRESSQKTQTLINARLNEGFSQDDFESVIRHKVKEWKGTTLDSYLRPETLFGTKFEGYLQASLKKQNITLKSDWL